MGEGLIRLAVSGLVAAAIVGAPVVLIIWAIRSAIARAIRGASIQGRRSAPGPVRADGGPDQVCPSCGKPSPSGGAFGGEAGVSNSMNDLSHVHLAEGRREDAADVARDASGLARREGPRGGVRWSLQNLARAALGQGEPAIAARFLAAAVTLREAEGTPIGPGEAARRDGLAASARKHLSAEAFKAAWAEGRAMALEEAADYALDVRTS